MFLKKLGLLFVATVIVLVAIPAFGEEYYMDSVDNYKAKVDRYFEGVKAYEGAVDNKNRVVDERLNDLEAREQQQSPPAGQFWPEPAPQPTVVAVSVPVPAPTWGWRYYRYWDAVLYDWVFAPIRCPVGWAPPHGWYSVSYGERYRFRHFSRGWVNGERLSCDRPVDLHPRGAFYGNRIRSEAPHGNFNTPHANTSVVHPQGQFQRQVGPMTRPANPPQNFQRPQCPQPQGSRQGWSGGQQGGAPDWRQSQPRGGGGNWNSQGTPNWSSRGGGGGGHRY